MSASAELDASRPEHVRATRTLSVTGLNHALHDGYTDLIYVLLPVWQAEFALSYGLLALLRGLYAGAMAGLQIPVGRIAERIDGKIILIAGTALSALGYVFAGLSGGVIGLGLALALSGAGSSTQHPIASAAVSRAYGSAARGPLGIYNFSGDLGKAAIPAATSILLVIMSWRHTLLVLAVAGLLVAVCIALWMPSVGKGAERKTAAASRHASAGGFSWLLAIGILDTAVRMGFLTFLPFLLQAKGAGTAGIGLALTLLFIGGAFGKLFCGYLGARIGMMKTVWLTEGSTALLIVAAVYLPLSGLMVMLPVLGLVLNGTSSVLYGAVPDLAPAEKREQAFAVFYTGTIGGGALAPVVFGGVGDALGVTVAVMLLAGILGVTLPLAWVVQRGIHSSD